MNNIIGNIIEVIKNKKLYEVLFLIAFALWFVPHHLIMTEWNTRINMTWSGEWYLKFIRYVIFFLVYFVGHKIDLRELICDGFFLGLAYVVAGNCHSSGIFTTALFVVVAKCIDYKVILKVTSVFMVLVMIVTVTCSIIGIIPNKDWNPLIGCYAFGYDYSTFLGYMIFFVMLQWLMCISIGEKRVASGLCVTKEKGKVNDGDNKALGKANNGDNNEAENVSVPTGINSPKWMWLVAITTLMVQIVNYILSDTLTTPLLTLMVWIIYFALVYGFKKIPRVIGWLGCLVPMGLMCGSWLLAKVYGPSTTESSIPGMTSIIMRLDLAHRALKEHHMTWLGQKIRWVGAGTNAKHPELTYNYVDNFYVKNLLSFGIIYMLVIIVAFSILIYKAYKKQNMEMFVALISLMLFGVLDAEVVDMRFHPMILLIGMAWTFADDRFKLDWTKLVDRKKKNNKAKG